MRTASLAVLGAILLALALPLAGAQATGYTCEAVYYEVLPDGSVFVNQTIRVVEAPVELVVEPEAPPILAWALDAYGNFLPIEFNDTMIVVSVYEPTTVNLTYYTQGLTSKDGPYWRLTVNPECKAYIILPQDAVPIEVEPANPEATLVAGKLALVFEPGQVTITYMLVPGVPPATTTPAPTATAGETTTTGTTSPAETGGEAGVPETGTAGEGGFNPLWILVALVVVAGAALYFFRSKKDSHRETGGPGITVAPRTPLDERDRKILEALKEGPKTAGEIMQETGIPKTPLYRRLKRLMEEGLIEVVEEEGARKYRLREGQG